MRIVFIALVAVAACTKHNPNACCTTTEQCSALGLDGVTTCKSDLVCDQTGACVMPQCSTSADCTSPDKPICIGQQCVMAQCSTSADCTSSDKPICVGQQCVAKCTSDPDCTGLAGTPHCGSDGVCVACVDSSQCSMAMPVCDSQLHTCRTCTEDTECASGVCLDQDGVCADPQQLIYLRADGSDSGTCTSSAPCLTFGYAFQKVTSTRQAIHILGTAFTAGNNTVALPFQSVYIDGEDTTVTGNGSGAVFSASQGTAAISRITVGRSGQSSFSMAGGTVHIYGSQVQGPIVMTGGTLEFAHSSLTNGLFGIDCSGTGAFSVEQSQIHTKVRSQGCPATVKQSVFDSTAGHLVLIGSAVMQVENNVFTSTDYFTDSSDVEGLSGSYVRFNTFVNVSGVSMGANSLVCNGAVDVTSNIFAWHTTNPPQNCSPRYSLFDSVVGAQPGTGNRVGDAATFFKDMTQHDFHLAAGSPAIDGAEPGLPVTVDLDGHMRPNGSASDMGAYEAP